MTRYRVSGINIGLDDKYKDLRVLVAGATGLDPKYIEHARLCRRSIDARKKDRIRLVLSIDFSLPPGEEPGLNPKIKRLPEPTPDTPPILDSPPANRPVVVGTGPAGLFAALILAEHGAPPLVVERGAPVEERSRSVSAFWRGEPLDPESNVQFGEGGAGTFSDGKLTTRIDDHRVRRVLETLVEHGAPEDVLYDAKPHVGTDRLRQVVRSLRDRIIGLGGRVLFHTRLTGITASGGAVSSVRLEGEDMDADTLILAPGNAARDTFSMLAGAGVDIRSKPFAVGLRIEHPREFIDRAQYGRSAGHRMLGAADYALTFRDKTTKRSAYTFCMCPGGYVVNASSEPGGVAVNGMSYGRRDSDMSNSAIVVTVTPDDFPDGPLGGVMYQRELEKKAFDLGGGVHGAPAQRLSAFLKGGDSGDVSRATVRPGPVPAELGRCLPGYVRDTVANAVLDFDVRIRGFNHPDAILTATETRTSSPVRISRSEDMQSMSLKGLYPCGEGSGYAGGIVSSAVDGMKAAESAIRALAGITG